MNRFERLRPVVLVRENIRLRDENARLRRTRDDLAASAELWIRLYEAALVRQAGSDGSTAVPENGPSPLLPR